MTCLLETFLEDGREDYLQYPPGFSAIFHPASRNLITGRASGGFCMLYKTATVKAKTSDFRALSESIFYGPVTIQGKRIFIIMVYRTKNAGSAVFDETFYDHLHGLLESLSDEFVVLGGDFNAKIGDMTGALSFLDDAGRLIPKKSESPETDQAGADLLSVLACYDFFGIFDLSSGVVRNTFRNRNGIGGSVIDLVYVNDRILPQVVRVDCSFHKPCNHARVQVSLRVEQRTSAAAPITTGETTKRFIRLFDLEKLRNVRHTEGMIQLANDPSNLSVQEGLEILIDFVDSFTQVVEVSRSKKKKCPADTRRASRAARQTEAG